MGASPAPGRPHPAVSTVLGEGPESRGNRSAPQAPLLVASRACQRPSHRGDRCGSLLGPGSAVPRKESRVEIYPPPAQPPGWAPDPVTKGLTPRKGGGCGRAPQGSLAPTSLPEPFAQVVPRLPRARAVPTALLSLITDGSGQERRPCSIWGALRQRPGHLDRRGIPCVAAFSNDTADTDCRAPVGTRERQRTPARARPPSLRDGAPRAACGRATTRC